MKSTRPVDPAAIHGKKWVPLSLFTLTGTLQFCALLVELLNQMSKTFAPVRLSAKTEYTLPLTPATPESSTASVAKMSSVLVFDGPSKIRCASQLRPLFPECAIQT